MLTVSPLKCSRTSLCPVAVERHPEVRQGERRSQGKRLRAVTLGQPRRLGVPWPRAFRAPAVAPRGTSDPARQHAAALPSPVPRPRARCAPSSYPCRAPPHPASVPTPGPSHRPLAWLPRLSELHGSGEPTRRQLARGTMARRLRHSPAAGSLRCLEPAVQAAAPRGGPGTGGREEAAAADWPALGQPRARPSLSRSPELGARAPARLASPPGHMAPLRTLLSCLLPLHCALCAAAGSPRTPGACGSGTHGVPGARGSEWAKGALGAGQRSSGWEAVQHWG